VWILPGTSRSRPEVWEKFCELSRSFSVINPGVLMVDFHAFSINIFKLSNVSASLLALLCHVYTYMYIHIFLLAGGLKYVRLLNHCWDDWLR